MKYFTTWERVPTHLNELDANVGDFFVVEDILQQILSAGDDGLYECCEVFPNQRKWSEVRQIFIED
jgi:hypothetical protein